MDQAVKLCGYSNKMINLWTQRRNSAEITSCACIFPVSPSCLHTFLCITSRSVLFVSLTPTSEQVWSPTFESMLFVFHSCNAPTVCRDCGSEGGACMWVCLWMCVCDVNGLKFWHMHQNSPFIQWYEPTWASLWVNSNSSASVSWDILRRLKLIHWFMNKSREFQLTTLKSQ